MLHIFALRFFLLYIIITIYINTEYNLTGRCCGSFHRLTQNVNIYYVFNSHILYIYTILPTLLLDRTVMIILQRNV